MVIVNVVEDIWENFMFYHETFSAKGENRDPSPGYNSMLSNGSKQSHSQL